MNLSLNFVDENIQSNNATTYFYVNKNTMKSNKKNKLDEYFTKPEISYYLYNKFCQIIIKNENTKNTNMQNIFDKYIWIEPSFGNGAFLNLLPKNNANVIGIDININENNNVYSNNYNVIKSDFLKYKLPKHKPFIIIGNPPFGHRGVLALEFIKHAQNADFIACILPMFFTSVGKGSIRYRIPKNLHLLHEEILPKNSFFIPTNNKEVDVKCCFQIYSKNYKNETLETNNFNWYKTTKQNAEPFNKLLKVITVSLAKNRECGKEYIFNKKANFYLSSTFFKENFVVDCFEKVKYKSGIAIIYNDEILNNSILKNQLDNLFLNADWKQYSTPATNGCFHIGKSHIYKLLKDNNYEQYQ